VQVLGKEMAAYACLLLMVMQFAGPVTATPVRL
jgi:hypothetical protein